MVNWYIKGQSEYIAANFHMGFYIDHSGFSEGDYGSQDMETHGSTSDPFMAFGIDTGPASWTYGQQQTEIGLLKSHRIKIDTTGCYKWIGPGQDDWALLEAGGGGGKDNLYELDDVVIDGTPADNELLAYDNGTSKWINQTPAEAGLDIHTEDHDNTHHTTNYHTESDGTGAVTVHSGITDAGSGIIISTGERNALHSIYSLEQHDNTYHSTNYEPAFNKNQAFNKDWGTTSGTVAQGNDSRFHTIVVAGDLNHNDLANINAGDAYEHITQTQKDALHSIYTLEQHAMDSATYHSRTDITTLDASISFHGFLKKLNNDSTYFMNGVGAWAVPPGGAHTHDGDTLQLDGINSDGVAFTFATSGAINLKPSGDTVDYLQLNTSGESVQIKRISGSEIQFDSDDAGVVTVQIQKGAANFGLMLTNIDTTPDARIISSAPITIFPQTTTTYGVKFSHAASIPYIEFLGAQGYIQNVKDPALDQDAATKKYVDDNDNLVLDTSPQLGGDLDLNEHNIVMDIALDADGDYQAIVMRTATVDENTFGFGGLLHLQADGHYDDASNSAIGDMPCSAIAVESGTGTKKIMKIGFIRDDTWNFTVGDPVIVGDNGTAISIVALDVGDYTQIVGIAESADSMWFNPALDYVKRKA